MSQCTGWPPHIGGKREETEEKLQEEKEEGPAGVSLHLPARLSTRQETSARAAQCSSDCICELFYSWQPTQCTIARYPAQPTLSAPHTVHIALLPTGRWSACGRMWTSQAMRQALEKNKSVQGFLSFNKANRRITLSIIFHILYFYHYIGSSIL